MCFRLYYRGANLDPTFPPPKPPKDVLIAGEKTARKPAPQAGVQDAAMVPLTVTAAAAPSTTTVAGPATAMPALAKQHVAHVGKTPDDDDVNETDLAEIVDGPSLDDRRSTLKEVREHLDLLKEFEGVISQDELIKRKRELFLALPPAPPPSTKRSRNE